MTSSPHATTTTTTTLPSFSSKKEKTTTSSSSLESHFTLSKSRVNDAVETLEKNILENTRKTRERTRGEENADRSIIRTIGTDERDGRRRRTDSDEVRE